VETSVSSSISPANEGTLSRKLHANSEEVIKRLHHIYGLTADKDLLKLIKEHKSGSLTPDAVNNCLMAVFRDHALVDAYSLLYELNYKQFMLIIFNKIKYYSHVLDPKDILQEVFLSIYRYPHRFRHDKEHAFRNWTYSIIRNTIFKHLKLRKPHDNTNESLLEVVEDRREKGPLHALVRKEGLKKFKTLYIYYLILYLNIVNNYLSAREKHALQLVEVEDKRYREASQILGIKLENFKMVVCRARKKILKHMYKLLGDDEP
jgi:RNA polymerase sigma factor (sigma-70 family)